VAKRRRGPPGWLTSRNILYAVFEDLAPNDARIDIGKVERMGEGAYRTAWGAWIDLAPDPQELSGAYCVVSPHEGTDSEDHQRIRQEFSALRFLHSKDLSFEVPRPISLAETPHGPALVRAFADGFARKFTKYSKVGTPPWEAVGQIAAELHKLDPFLADPPLHGPRSRREFALEKLAIFDQLNDPELEPFHNWCQEHIPADGPSCLIHGDLHGENIIRDFDGPPTVIDWEFAALGDPAYELSVITKGVHRPFKQPNGLPLLIEAYHTAGGEPIPTQAVHFYDLCTFAFNYGLSLNTTRGHSSEHYLSNLHALLNRATKRPGSRNSPNQPRQDTT